MEEMRDAFLKWRKSRKRTFAFSIEKNKAEGLHLVNNILEGVIFEPTVIVKDISNLSRKNQSDILNKESAVHSSSGVDTKTFHIKIIFEVMEVLFNGVF